ncbi:MAG: hypothetical protein OEV40_10420 [Acidimicrobiia bacterium]|nr:hypothetical protein [Acidimicrobiia bacterium]
MPALPPTVLERVARCGTRVPVTGLVPGSTVVLTIDGTDEPPVTATGGGFTFTVDPLAGGVELTARQDPGSGFTPPSPPVVVEEVAVPPAVGPLLPTEVGGCSQCVLVGGLVPGCDVELFQAGNTVGTGTANRHGEACVRVALRPPRDETEVLTARMTVCGSDGPLSSTPIVPDGSLGPAVVGAPLYGCQSRVPLGQLHRGAKTMLETDTGTYLGWICNCWSAVGVNVLHPLVPGERVRAKQYWDGDQCTAEGPPSDWEDVIPPDDGIRPEVQEALIEGDQLIRVANQIPGGEIVVLVRDDPASAAVRWGPRPASTEPEIALAEPLKAGQQVAAEQRLCGHIETSEWVDVLPIPPVITPPVVLPPLYECGGAVQVSGLIPGAIVRVFQDSIPCGLGLAGTATSITVAAAPALAAGSVVTAIQWVGGQPSPPSDPVEVQPIERLEQLSQPRILPPVAFGDRGVWVSGVTPGSLVAIRSAGQVIGEAYAGEPLLRIPVQSVAATVSTEARLCDRVAVGSNVEPIVSPCSAGPFPSAAESTEDLGQHAVDVYPTDAPEPDGGFEIDLRVRLYLPAEAGGKVPDTVRNRPFVVIVHGFWDTSWEDPDSHTGYGWLAQHLARWGMVVASVDVSTVNRQTGTALQQWARGDVVLAVIDRLLVHSAVEGRVDRARIGLVGHSMGGEGVVMAQELNLGRPNPYGIRGVVSLAPTQYRPDVSCREAAYLQLHGSLDYLLGGAGDVTGPSPRFGAFRIYDRAWRDRTLVFIDGARHQAWNPYWLSLTSFPDVAAAPNLSDVQQQEIGRCLIGAFFRDVLDGEAAYRGYLDGLHRPERVVGLELSVEHQRPPQVVVDDFGDASPQLGVSEETPIDRAVNRLGATVTAASASGAGLDHWADVEHVTLPLSVHDTVGTDLAWNTDDDVVYSQTLTGVSAAPDRYLALRIAQHYDEDSSGDPDATWNPPGFDLDLFVELSDSSPAAETAVVRLGMAGVVSHPYPGPQPYSIFRSVRIPLDAFAAVNPALALTSLAAIRLQLRGRATGRILVDDIEVSS